MKEMGEIKYKLEVPYTTQIILLKLKDSILSQLVKATGQALTIDEIRQAKRFKQSVTFRSK